MSKISFTLDLSRVPKSEEAPKTAETPKGPEESATPTTEVATPDNAIAPTSKTPEKTDLLLASRRFSRSKRTLSRSITRLDGTSTPRSGLLNTAMRAHAMQIEKRRVQLMDIFNRVMTEVTEAQSQDLPTDQHDHQSEMVVSISDNHLQAQQQLVERKYKLIEELRKKLLSLQHDITECERERTEISQRLKEIEDAREDFEEELAAGELLVMMSAIEADPAQSGDDDGNSDDDDDNGGDDDDSNHNDHHAPPQHSEPQAVVRSPPKPVSRTRSRSLTVPKLGHTQSFFRAAEQQVTSQLWSLLDDESAQLQDADLEDVGTEAPRLTPRRKSLSGVLDEWTLRERSDAINTENHQQSANPDEPANHVDAAAADESNSVHSNHSVHSPKNSDHGSFESEVEMTPARVEEIKAFLVQLKEEKTHLEDAIISLDEAITQLHDESQRVTEELDKATEDLKEASRVLDEAWAGVQSAHTEAEKAREEEWMKQRAQASKISERLSYFAKLRTSALQEISHLFDGMDSMSLPPHLSKVLSQVNSVRKELEQLRATASTSTKGMTEMIEIERVRVTSMVGIAQKAWERRCTHLDAKVAERDETIQDLTSRLGTLEGKARALDSDLKRATAAKADALKAFDAERLGRDEAMNELRLAQERVQILESDLQIQEEHLQIALQQAQVNQQRADALEMTMQDSKYTLDVLAESSQTSQTAMAMGKAGVVLDELKRQQKTVETTLRQEISQLTLSLNAERRAKEQLAAELEIVKESQQKFMIASPISARYSTDDLEEVPRTRAVRPPDSPIVESATLMQNVIEESKLVYQRALATLETDLQKSSETERQLMKEIVELKASVTMHQELLKQTESTLAHWESEVRRLETKNSDQALECRRLAERCLQLESTQEATQQLIFTVRSDQALEQSKNAVLQSCLDDALRLVHAEVSELQGDGAPHVRKLLENIQQGITTLKQQQEESHNKAVQTFEQMTRQGAELTTCRSEFVAAKLQLEAEVVKRRQFEESAAEWRAKSESIGGELFEQSLLIQRMERRHELEISRLKQQLKRFGHRRLSLSSMRSQSVVDNAPLSAREHYSRTNLDASNANTDMDTYQFDSRDTNDSSDELLATNVFSSKQSLQRTRHPIGDLNRNQPAQEANSRPHIPAIDIKRTKSEAGLAPSLTHQPSRADSETDTNQFQEVDDIVKGYEHALNESMADYKRLGEELRQARVKARERIHELEAELSRMRDEAETVKREQNHLNERVQYLEMQSNRLSQREKELLSQLSVAQTKLGVRDSSSALLRTLQANAATSHRLSEIHERLQREAPHPSPDLSVVGTKQSAAPRVQGRHREHSAEWSDGGVRRTLSNETHHSVSALSTATQETAGPSVSVRGHSAVGSTAALLMKLEEESRKRVRAEVQLEEEIQHARDLQHALAITTSQLNEAREHAAELESEREGLVARACELTTTHATEGFDRLKAVLSDERAKRDAAERQLADMNRSVAKKLALMGDDTNTTIGEGGSRDVMERLEEMSQLFAMMKQKLEDECLAHINTQATADEWQAKYEQMMHDLEDERRQWTSTSSKTENRTKTEQQRLQRMRDELRQTLASKSEELDHVRTEVTEQQGELEQARESVNQLQEELTKASLELESTTSELKHTKDALKRAIAEAEQLRGEVTQLKSHNAELIEVADHASSSKPGNAQVDQELQDARENLDSLVAQCDVQTQHLNEICDKIQKSQDELTTLQAERERLQGEITKLSTNRAVAADESDMAQQADEEIDALKKKLSAEVASRETAEKAIKELETHVETQQAQLDKQALEISEAKRNLVRAQGDLKSAKQEQAVLEVTRIEQSMRANSISDVGKFQELPLITNYSLAAETVRNILVSCDIGWEELTDTCVEGLRNTLATTFEVLSNEDLSREERATMLEKNGHQQRLALATEGAQLYRWKIENNASRFVERVNQTLDVLQRAGHERSDVAEKWHAEVAAVPPQSLLMHVTCEKYLRMLSDEVDNAVTSRKKLVEIKVMCLSREDQASYWRHADQTGADAITLWKHTQPNLENAPKTKFLDPSLIDAVVPHGSKAFHTLVFLQDDYEHQDPKYQDLQEVLPLIQQIDKFEAKMREFEVRSSDPTRLFTGTAIDRLEEEKFRARYSSQYPKLLAQVRKELQAWEAKHRQQFLVYNQPYMHHLDLALRSVNPRMKLSLVSINTASVGTVSILHKTPQNRVTVNSDQIRPLKPTIPKLANMPKARSQSRPSLRREAPQSSQARDLRAQTVSSASRLDAIATPRRRPVTLGAAARQVVSTNYAVKALQQSIDPSMSSQRDKLATFGAAPLAETTRTQSQPSSPSSDSESGGITVQPPQLYRNSRSSASNAGSPKSHSYAPNTKRTQPLSRVPASNAVKLADVVRGVTAARSRVGPPSPKWN